MIICSECFRDQEVKSRILNKKRFGQCSVCGRKNVTVYDTAYDHDLEYDFESLITSYTPQEDYPDTYDSKLESISSSIQKDWRIFSEVDDDSILQILKAIAPAVVQEYPALFEQPVGIVEKEDPKYLQMHSLLHSGDWDDFVETIKHRNRFHSNFFDNELFQKYCSQIAIQLEPDDKRFYRGRIASESKGFTRRDMGAPPSGKATNGRANAMGISRLYLTDNRDTTFHEIRAAEYDYVTVGTFKLLEPIKIVDLTRMNEISPFSDEVDITALAINQEHLKMLNKELAHPMRRGDSPLDYLPTQFISDLIMSMQNKEGEPLYDGIRYMSAMHQVGSNYTIFYPEKFKCTYCKTYEVKNLSFDYQACSRD